MKKFVDVWSIARSGANFGPSAQRAANQKSLFVNFFLKTSDRMEYVVRYGIGDISAKVSCYFRMTLEPRTANFVSLASTSTNLHLITTHLSLCQLIL